MLKKITIVISIIVISIVSYFIYLIATLSLFDENSLQLINELEVPNKEYTLRLYYIPSNATSQSYIQVRKVILNEEEVIENYERYNFINGYEFTNDSIFQLVLSDTLFIDRKIDTIQLKLP